MTELFLRFVNTGISASWLVAAILLLRPLLKKAPKWVNPLLWGIAGLRLVLPFSIPSALSLVPSAETIGPDILCAGEPAIQSGVPALNRVVNPILLETFAPEAGASVNPLQIWIPAAAVLWAIGIAAMLFYAAVSWLGLKRRVRTAVVLRDNIYQSENIPSPFVLGLLRPRIYLPFGMGEEDAASVIAHEQAHIRRKDHWIKPAGFLLLSLYWFNPLLWAAYLFLCRDIELACDERVVRNLTPKERADYSQALLSLGTHRKGISACPLAFGEVGVKSRVKNVLNYKKPAFWIVAAAVAVSAVLAVCFLTDPKEGGETGGTGQPAVTWAFRPASSVSWNAAFYFTFDLSYTHLEAECSAGELWDIEGDGQPMGSALRFEGGRPVCWHPSGGKTFAAGDAEITFTVYDGQAALYSGKIRITRAAKEREDAPFSYEARLFDCAGLILEQDGETGGGKLAAASGAGAGETPVLRWFDVLSGPDKADWENPSEIRHPAFPEVTFFRRDGKVEAVTADKTVTLFMGQPVLNAYFCDLTGDGNPELCSTVGFGSGILDYRVIVYDWAAGISGELSDRGTFDYLLRLDGETGCLFLDQRPYGRDERVSTGRLAYEDGVVRMIVEAAGREELSFDALCAWAGFSEEGYAAMARAAVNPSSLTGEGGLPLVKLETRADFEAFRAEMAEYFAWDQSYDGTESFSQQAGRYTEDFFAGRALLITYIIEPSSSNRHRVAEVGAANGVLELKIERLVPETGDTAMAGWMVAVEVSKADLAGCSGYTASVSG